MSRPGDPIRRRIVLAMVLSIASVARPTHAQTGKGSAHVGWMGNANAKTQAPALDAFRRKLADLGWIEGKNMTLTVRWAEGNSANLPLLAAELVRLKVDVIVTSGSAGIRAAQQATRTVPIVFTVLLVDPVEQGLVSSLARPGGNTTGIASQYEEIVTKHVQLLSEALPGIVRMGVLRNRNQASITQDAALAAARKLGLQAQVFSVGDFDVAEWTGAFKAARATRMQAMLVLPSPFFSANRRELIALASAYSMPAFYEFSGYVEDGGLMSYGPNLVDMHRRAASHVDRVLRGAKPAEIPVERAAIFEFVINMQTAKALGISIPQSLVFRADRLIQ